MSTMCVCFNALLMHECDWVFCGLLVIVIHLFVSPAMAELISDFLSYHERPWIFFLFWGYHHCVLISNKLHSGTFLLLLRCLDFQFSSFHIQAIIHLFLIFLIIVTLILFCFFILFTSVTSGIPSHFLWDHWSWDK